MIWCADALTEAGAFKDLTERKGLLYLCSAFGSWERQFGCRLLVEAGADKDAGKNGKSPIVQMLSAKWMLFSF